MEFEFGLVESITAELSYIIIILTYGRYKLLHHHNSTKLINFDQYNAKVVVGSCRRYDTSGFFLKESRITKYAMIKRLDEQKANQNVGSREASSSGESLIDKLRNSFFVK